MTTPRADLAVDGVAGQNTALRPIGHTVHTGHTFKLDHAHGIREAALLIDPGDDAQGCGRCGQGPKVAFAAALRWTHLTPQVWPWCGRGLARRPCPLEYP